MLKKLHKKLLKINFFHILSYSYLNKKSYSWWKNVYYPFYLFLENCNRKDSKGVYVPPIVTDVSATFVDSINFRIPGTEGLKASNCWWVGSAAYKGKTFRGGYSCPSSCLATCRAAAVAASISSWPVKKMRISSLKRKLKIKRLQHRIFQQCCRRFVL